MVKINLVYMSQKIQFRLSVDEDGSATLVPEIDITSGGKSVVITAGDAGGFDDVDLDIIIEYIEVA